MDDNERTLIKICNSKEAGDINNKNTYFIQLITYDIYDIYENGMEKGELYDKLFSYIIDDITNKPLTINRSLKYIWWLEGIHKDDEIVQLHNDIEVIIYGRSGRYEDLEEGIRNQIDVIKYREATQGNLMRDSYNRGELKLITLIEEFYSPKPINKKFINEEKTFKGDKCIICLDKEPNVILCNCGHMVICKECRSLSLNNNKCMMCKEINKIIRIL